MAEALLRRLREAAGRRPFARAVALLAGGTAAAQVLALLAAPLLTRLYPPAEFGVFAVYSAAVSILAGVASLRYNLAVPLPEDDGTAAHVLALACLAAASLAGLLWAAAQAAGAPLARAAGAEALIPHLGLLPAGFLAAGLYQAAGAWAVRRKAFKDAARAALLVTAAQVAAQASLGWAGAGPRGLMLGYVVGQSTGAAALALSAWRGSSRALRAVRPAGIAAVAVRYRRFPLLSASSGLLNNAGAQLPALCLSAFYGAQVAGWHAITQRAAAGLRLIDAAVGQVYFATAARMFAARSPELPAFYKSIARRILLWGALPAAALAAAAPPLFAWVFGSDWREAGVYLRLLAPMLLVQSAVSPLSITCVVIERQDLQLAWDAVRLAAVGGAFAAAHGLGAEPARALAFYGALMAAFYGALYWMYLRALEGLAEEGRAHDLG